MEAIRDIFINLFSDAVWALGGFLIARLALKKQLYFQKNLKTRLFKKTYSAVHMNRQAL